VILAISNAAEDAASRERRLEGPRRTARSRESASGSSNRPVRTRDRAIGSGQSGDRISLRSGGMRGQRDVTEAEVRVVKRVFTRALSDGPRSSGEHARREHAEKQPLPRLESRSIRRVLVQWVGLQKQVRRVLCAFLGSA
jgi:hypothetical protein